MHPTKVSRPRAPLGQPAHTLWKTRVTPLRAVDGTSAPGASAPLATDPSAEVIAWPPNWLRSAATTFIAGESSCREANLAYSAAVITGSGTAWSTAAWTVHRPSPESCA